MVYKIMIILRDYCESEYKKDEHNARMKQALKTTYESLVVLMKFH